MDRETFLLTREQIQVRMEEIRTNISLSAPSLSIRGSMAVIFYLVAPIFKIIFLKNKKTIFQTIVATLGLRFLSPFIAQRVWGFVSKINPRPHELRNK